MQEERKIQQDILSKFGITELNSMQNLAIKAIDENPNVVLLSPTGTGKTLAFLLPLLTRLDHKLNQVQALIIVPSRELAIQIENVARDMGSGFKINSIYGGRPANKDRKDLKSPPAILIGTPGRVADHIRNGALDTGFITTLILDEYDKSLEVGFEDEMMEIYKSLKHLEKKILTSATQKVKIPSFLELTNLKRLSFLKNGESKLEVKIIVSQEENKLTEIKQLLQNLGNKRGIVFCNLKESIELVSESLKEINLNHDVFHGGLEQPERERSLIKFKNGSQRVLLSTDLAARGIDVADLDYIIHYELPPKEHEFVHRNGRTARMKSDGIAYVLKWKDEESPLFLQQYPEVELLEKPKKAEIEWVSLHISGGRVHKISKGDIVGLFIKVGGLAKEDLGQIELKSDSAFIAVPKAKAQGLISKLNNTRLKSKKVRISIYS